MFIVHYEDGKTISEADKSWDEIPKDNIRAVQLKWDSFDFIKVLKERIDQLSLVIDSGQQFKQHLAEEIEKYLIHKSDTDTVRIRIAHDVLEKAKSTLASVEGDIEKYKIELNILNEQRKVSPLTSTDQEIFQKHVEMLGRSEGSKSFLSVIILDMESFLQSDIKMATVIGSSKHKYGFWQDKTGMYNLTSAKDLGPFEQRAGMVVDKEGHTVVCEMNLRTGAYKIYYTTIDSLRLDLRVFPHIKLSEMG